MRRTPGHRETPASIAGPVRTEVCYLIEREQGPYAGADFLDALANGEFELIHPTVDDVRRMAELVRTYHDLPLGAIDACVIALAERLGDFDVATLDRRHFNVVRPAGNRYFTLRP